MQRHMHRRHLELATIVLVCYWRRLLVSLICVSIFKLVSYQNISIQCMYTVPIHIQVVFGGILHDFTSVFKDRSVYVLNMCNSMYNVYVSCISFLVIRLLINIMLLWKRSFRWYWVFYLIPTNMSESWRICRLGWSYNCEFSSINT